MELFQVRYFLTLAKTLNFTRAAEACNVTQPALTRAIQRLEEELGGPLLYRERNLTQLTELGRAMLPHLETVFLATQTATAQAAAFKRRDETPLRVGLNRTISAAILTPVLRELEARLSKFQLTLVSNNSDELFGRMLEGELDSAVVVASHKQAERLHQWPLFRERYVVLCRNGHRFATLSEVSPEALTEECILWRTGPGCDFEEVLEKYALRGDSKIPIRHRADGEDEIRHLIAAGLGIAISAAHQPVLPGLVAVPLGEAIPPRTIVVTAVAGRPHGPGLSAFLKLMRARDWSAGPFRTGNPPVEAERAA